MYRLPFANEPGWSLWQGNHDDYGHGTFQYYAFDIGHKVRGKVLTARGGEVIYVKNNVGKNTWNLSTFEKVKYGAGSHVVIKHKDGTVAVYCHLKKGSIVVKKNDKVVQGEFIGYSGDTGNSSDPHLHFEVRAYYSKAPPKDHLMDIGPTLPVIFEDQNHSGWRPKKGDELASNNGILLFEEAWSWCNKCQGLFYDIPGYTNKCPVSGKHNSSGSGNYSLLCSDNAMGQKHWRRCKKCQGLFSIIRLPGHTDKCPVYGEHSPIGKSYWLEREPEAAETSDSRQLKNQLRWRACKKCAGLFFAGNPGSKCPANGEHDDSESEFYGLMRSKYNYVQGLWRKCSKCQGLFSAFGPSICPDGGQHTKTNEWYWLGYDSPKYPGQHNWRMCIKCKGLFYIDWNPSKCPDGTQHSGGNQKFTLHPSKLRAPDQSGWHLCHRCKGLFYSGNKTGGGKCPSVAGAHSMGSGDLNFGVWIAYKYDPYNDLHIPNA